MKKSFRIIAVLLVCVLSLALVFPVFATESGEQDESLITAEIAMVKGGANGIATFAFDDAYWLEALALNDLCKKHNIRATLFMNGNDVYKNTGTVENPTYIPKDNASDWKDLINQGYLDVSSHAWSDTNGATVTEENDIRQEIVASRDKLSECFGSPVVGYGPPSGGLSVQSYAVMRKTYYASRSGSSLADGAIQSLDPAITPATATRPTLGSWHSLATIRPNTNPARDNVVSYDIIEAMLDKAATEGGWLLPVQHGVAGNHTHQEMTYEQFDRFLAHAVELRSEGKLWIATFEEAVRYIRERQNTTVNVNGNTVSLTMAETTADGLALDPAVFNMALTVKINVPTYWTGFDIVRADGTKETVTTKREGGLNFGYVDILPNESITIESGKDISEYIGGIKQSISVDESIVYNLYVPKTSPVSKVTLFDGDNAADSGVVIEGVDMGEYFKYEAPAVFIDDVDHVYNFEVALDPNLGLPLFNYSISGISYLNSLLNDSASTAQAKQLGYDFAKYALESYRYLNQAVFKSYPANNPATMESYPKDVKAVYSCLNSLSAVVDSYSAKGFAAFNTSSAQKVSEKTIGSAIRGAAFTLNEKPYYLLYLKEGFTGTLTVEYTGVDGETRTETFVAKNGHYNLRDYIVVEVESVYDLVAELRITASGRIHGGASSVTANGSYSIVNYCKAHNNALCNSLLAYVMSANAYFTANNDFTID